MSETLDWARTLVLLGIDSIDAEQAKETLHILLKYQTDIAKADEGTLERPGGAAAPCSNSSLASSQELRNAGLPVSLTESIDAMEAVTHIPLEDRQAFKYALAATMVKCTSHWRAFETVFEVYFSLRAGDHVEE